MIRLHINCLAFHSTIMYGIFVFCDLPNGAHDLGFGSLASTGPC
jgi:hypothetical protein